VVRRDQHPLAEASELVNRSGETLIGRWRPIRHDRDHIGKKNSTETICVIEANDLGCRSRSGLRSLCDCHSRLVLCFAKPTVSSGLVTVVPAKSIAVLPFESLSENKTDSYFADGVQDEILNNLAKIAQLKVISRTSVMQYRADVKRDLRQIANALGVANVLEGAVRRNGNRVRVSTIFHVQAGVTAESCQNRR
jgi:hypothetical protein